MRFCVFFHLFDFSIVEFAAGLDADTLFFACGLVLG